MLSAADSQRREQLVVIGACVAVAHHRTLQLPLSADAATRKRKENEASAQEHSGGEHEGLSTRLG